MSILAEKILEHLAANDGEVTSLSLANDFSENHQKIIGALNSIKAHGDNLIETERGAQPCLVVTPSGQNVLENGSPEVVVFQAIPENGPFPQKELQKLPQGKIGSGLALSNGWIKLEKKDNVTYAVRIVEKVEDSIREALKLVQDSKPIPKDILQKCIARKLVKETQINLFKVKKGTEFSTTLPKLETDLTAQMLSSGDWNKMKFKQYNFNALGVQPECGYLHPLMKIRTEIKEIFLEMGFEEMPTNNYVENSFWNFDTLFVPQQHPARDAQDTFYVSDPACSTKFDEEYLAAVRDCHWTGAHANSKGYKSEWSKEEAQKNVMRTHTTASTARMLYAAAKKLKEENKFTPMKLFSIDKVFRNETLDATHLAEFHQVEGVVIDYDLTLGMLIGVLTEFFHKMGLTDLQFKPAYNPYTEPSMEIFCVHKGLDKTIEIGNSGKFRPELLLPMGFPENVTAIAWGLSLERPTMIKFGFNNIRELVGPKLDLAMVQRNPVFRIK